MLMGMHYVRNETLGGVLLWQDKLGKPNGIKVVTLEAPSINVERARVSEPRCTFIKTST